MEVFLIIKMIFLFQMIDLGWPEKSKAPGSQLKNNQTNVSYFLCRFNLVVEKFRHCYF